MINLYLLEQGVSLGLQQLLVVKFTLVMLHYAAPTFVYGERKL